MDATELLVQFQDHGASRLDTYEQAIYLYAVRHGRLVDAGIGVRPEHVRTPSVWV